MISTIALKNCNDKAPGSMKALSRSGKALEYKKLAVNSQSTQVEVTRRGQVKISITLLILLIRVVMQILTTTVQEVLKLNKQAFVSWVAQTVDWVELLQLRPRS